jgi:hypothetical protein
MWGGPWLRRSTAYLSVCGLFGDDTQYWNYRLNKNEDEIFALLSTSLTKQSHPSQTQNLTSFIGSPTAPSP